MKVIKNFLTWRVKGSFLVPVCIGDSGTRNGPVAPGLTGFPGIGNGTSLTALRNNVRFSSGKDH